MKAYVTLDYYDGTQGKAKLMYLEGADLKCLVFHLMEKDVCGFTVTKDKPIYKVVELLNKD